MKTDLLKELSKRIEENDNEILENLIKEFQEDRKTNVKTFSDSLNETMGFIISKYEELQNAIKTKRLHKDGSNWTKDEFKIDELIEKKISELKDVALKWENETFAIIGEWEVWHKKYMFKLMHVHCAILITFSESIIQFSEKLKSLGMNINDSDVSLLLSLTKEMLDIAEFLNQLICNYTESIK